MSGEEERDEHGVINLDDNAPFEAAPDDRPMIISSPEGPTCVLEQVRRQTSSTTLFSVDVSHITPLNASTTTASTRSVSDEDDDDDDAFNFDLDDDGDAPSQRRRSRGAPKKPKRYQIPGDLEDDTCERWLPAVDSNDILLIGSIGKVLWRGSDGACRAEFVQEKWNDSPYKLWKAEFGTSGTGATPASKRKKKQKNKNASKRSRTSGSTDDAEDEDVEDFADGEEGSDSEDEEEHEGENINDPNTPRFDQRFHIVFFEHCGSLSGFVRYVLHVNAETMRVTRVVRAKYILHFNKETHRPNLPTRQLSLKRAVKLGLFRYCRVPRAANLYLTRALSRNGCKHPASIVQLKHAQGVLTSAGPSQRNPAENLFDNIFSLQSNFHLLCLCIYGRSVMFNIFKNVPADVRNLFETRDPFVPLFALDRNGLANNASVNTVLEAVFYSQPPPAFLHSYALPSESELALIREAHSIFASIARSRRYYGSSSRAYTLKNDTENVRDKAIELLCGKYKCLSKVRISSSSSSATGTGTQRPPEKIHLTLPIDWTAETSLFSKLMTIGCRASNGSSLSSPLPDSRDDDPLVNQEQLRIERDYWISEHEDPNSVDTLGQVLDVVPFVLLDSSFTREEILADVFTRRYERNVICVSMREADCMRHNRIYLFSKVLQRDNLPFPSHIISRLLFLHAEDMNMIDMTRIIDMFPSLRHLALCGDPRARRSFVRNSLDIGQPFLDLYGSVLSAERSYTKRQRLRNGNDYDSEFQSITQRYRKVMFATTLVLSDFLTQRNSLAQRGFKNWLKKLMFIRRNATTEPGHAFPYGVSGIYAKTQSQLREVIAEADTFGVSFQCFTELQSDANNILKLAQKDESSFSLGDVICIAPKWSGVMANAITATSIDDNVIGVLTAISQRLANETVSSIAGGQENGPDGRSLSSLAFPLPAGSVFTISVRTFDEGGESEHEDSIKGTTFRFVFDQKSKWKMKHALASVLRKRSIATSTTADWIGLWVKRKMTWQDLYAALTRARKRLFVFTEDNVVNELDEVVRHYDGGCYTIFRHLLQSTAFNP